MAPLYRRRTFLQLLAAGGTVVTVPWLPGCSDRGGSGGAQAAHFFTADERATFDQLAAAIVPEDQTVGALGTDAVEYIDRFLAAFDASVPTLYRSGPFSGRTPYPDPATGDPGDDYPHDAFLEILPPTRMQELAFRIELLGSGSVPNGDVNDGIVPPTPGLQALYRDAVPALNAFAASRGAADFASLDDDGKLAAFAAADARFQDAFLQNLAEGMFCAPEYGGNRDGVGWRDYSYDGDSQPLGHTLYDASGTPRDRPDQPNQTIDPRRPNDGLEPMVEGFVTAVALSQGGKRFF
ncbi:gluconate 2-dehydrogenase subunit 3 family protein [Candidatus Binatia bacterium]|jgi:hypothetical protein|nr:gluconate 2-dehydrogenase subunit 3 family protein [Candidatus Binatia bacterium]